MDAKLNGVTVSVSFIIPSVCWTQIDIAWHNMSRNIELYYHDSSKYFIVLDYA